MLHNHIGYRDAVTMQFPTRQGSLRNNMYIKVWQIAPIVGSTLTNATSCPSYLLSWFLWSSLYRQITSIILFGLFWTVTPLLPIPDPYAHMSYTNHTFHFHRQISYWHKCYSTQPTQCYPRCGLNPLPTAFQQLGLSPFDPFHNSITIIRLYIYIVYSMSPCSWTLIIHHYWWYIPLLDYKTQRHNKSNT